MSEPSQTEPAQAKAIPPEHEYQYTTLREEALAIANETRKIEQLTVIALASLFAWLGTRIDQVPKTLWLLGIPLAILAGLRCLVLYRRILRISSYMRMIETAFIRPLPDHPELIGWENYLAKPKTEKLAYLAFVIWPVIIILSLLVPVIALLPRKHGGDKGVDVRITQPEPKAGGQSSTKIDIDIDR